MLLLNFVISPEKHIVQRNTGGRTWYFLLILLKKKTAKNDQQYTQLKSTEKEIQLQEKT